MLENDFLAIDGANIADKRKQTLLIHCLATEGQRIYYTLQKEGSVRALEGYFAPKVNVVEERYRFRQHAQHVCESTEHYIAALRELVISYEFVHLMHQRRDQIIEKTSTPRIQDRLLLVGLIKL